MALADLGKLIKEKHPGAYDDIPDGTLGRMTLQKYPQYADIAGVDPTTIQPEKVEQYQPSAAEKVYGFVENTAPGKLGQEVGKAIGTREGEADTKKAVGAGLGSIASILGLATMAPATVAGRAAMAGTTTGRVGQSAGIGSLVGAGTALEEDGGLGDVATGALAGGATGALASGAFEGAGKLTQMAGRALSSKGKDIALKGIRPSPSQIRNFKKQTGQDLTEFVTQRGFFSRGTEQVDEAIAPIQEAFDNIASRSGRKVTVEQLESAFKERAEELGKRSATKAKAQQLLDSLEDLKETYGNKPIDVADLTEERRLFDDLVRDFNAEPGKRSVALETRETLQDVIRRATSDLRSTENKSLEQLGKELRSLYSFRDIADKQAGLGKGSLLAGITQILGGAVGAGLGASAPSDGLGDQARNAILGAAAVSTLNNPRVIAGASRGMMRSGQAIQRRQLPPELVRLLQNLTAGAAAREVSER